MDTKSLKIGNYILHGDKIIAVTSAFPKGINAQFDRITRKISYIHADEIAPIPLSTDILRRFGFHQVRTRWSLRYTSNLFIDRAVEKYFISTGPLGDKVCQVKYVHQLQNLFADGWDINLKLNR